MSYTPIFVLALTGFNPAWAKREDGRPTTEEFHAWLDAGKPGASWEDCSLTDKDTGEPVGRVL